MSSHLTPSLHGSVGMARDGEKDKCLHVAKQSASPSWLADLSALPRCLFQIQIPRLDSAPTEWKLLEEGAL